MKNLKINTVLFNEDIQIAQCTDHFKYSIDSLILSSFVNLGSKVKKVLDIGTNNAIIPAMIWKRKNVEIDAIEIFSEAIPFAEKTKELNSISKLNIINKDFIKFADDIKPKKYDLIVSNPPYFEIDKTAAVKLNEKVVQARHNKTLSIEDLIKKSSQIIENQGRLALVLRPERLDEVISLLIKNKFSPKNLMMCQPKINRDVNLFVIDAVFNGNKGMRILPTLIVHKDNGDYSENLRKYLEV